MLMKDVAQWQKRRRNGDQGVGYFQTREITNRAFRHCDRTLSPPLPDCSTTYSPEIYTRGMYCRIPDKYLSYILLDRVEYIPGKYLSYFCWIKWSIYMYTWRMYFRLPDKYLSCILLDIPGSIPGLCTVLPDTRHISFQYLAWYMIYKPRNEWPDTRQIPFLFLAGYIGIYTRAMYCQILDKYLSYILLDIER